MTNSHGNNSGCFAGILRRILCTGNVPTHPSDQILDSNKVVESKSSCPEKEAKGNDKVHQIQSPSGPGIVARLMGLDSLPETKWVPGDRTPDSVSRSRSVNFADYLLKFDLSSNNEAQHHRRVRTSVSFREVPSSFNEQNHDFLFVYLDNANESTKEIGLKGKKCEAGFGEKKQGMVKEKSRSREKEKKRENERMKNNNSKKEKNEGTRKKILNLKDEPRRELVRKKNSKNCSTSGSGPKGLGSVLQKNVNINGGGDSKPENQKKVTKQKSNKKRKNQHAGKKIEPISQENSSGVSVIDIYDILIQNETQLSEDSLQSMNLKKKSSAKVHNSEGLLEGSAVKKEENEAVFNKWETEDYIELANQLNRLTDENIKESNWTSKDMLEFEGFDEEICMEFERKIVDNLLHQLIDELLEIP
ncbi:uncharacterized protein LOC125418965 isoform X2 [Ziziphus jujuba]|uniref:Uncharacterized protein LOC125418965 isoform X2 n=1 Tax=Ziziphus jujuba TaxID=326968 RepID=A0ABM3I321_ZIZJJ|nr:uncharacterized protein LOC125418965 isoform X2 [Ziziphus jujuba]